MAEPFDLDAWYKSSAGTSWNDWLNPASTKAKIAVFGSSTPEGFDSWNLNRAASAYLNSSYISSQEDYEKAYKVFKENPAEYYKSAVTAAAKNYGHTQSMNDYFGGETYTAPKGEYESIAKEAIEKGYLKPDEVVSISTPSYEQAYVKQSGYNNPDLSGGMTGFINTVAPIALAFVPGVGPALSAAYSAGATYSEGGSIGDALKAGAISYGASTLGSEIGSQFGAEAGAGGTDYLGSQALGDASTGAVGSGSTGFGFNPNAAGVGINAGTGSLLNSGFNAGSLPNTTGAPVVDMSRPVSVDQYGDVVANDTGLVTSTYDDGSTLITDSKTGNVVGGTDFNQQPFSVNNGIGTYAGGEPLGGTPETTFGGNLADPKDVKSLLDYNAAYADTGVSTSDVLRGVNAIKSLLASPEVPQQPTGNKSFVPKGNVNYDPLLNLLTMRASTPNLLSLLG